MGLSWSSAGAMPRPPVPLSPSPGRGVQAVLITPSLPSLAWWVSRDAAEHRSSLQGSKTVHGLTRTPETPGRVLDLGGSKRKRSLCVMHGVNLCLLLHRAGPAPWISSWGCRGTPQPPVSGVSVSSWSASLSFAAAINFRPGIPPIRFMSRSFPAAFPLPRHLQSFAHGALPSVP